MEQNVENTLALLTRTPAAVDGLLRGLPEAWTTPNEGGESWSARDIVGHYIDNERHNWMPRARLIREAGESKTFVPFDRSGHVGETKGKSLPELLDEFARLRAENLREVRGWNLRAEDLERKGRHPNFGAVTLSQLLATWAAHDLNHLHQMSRVMARQYREAVGPWSRFLGVMHCNAHGE